MTEEINDLRLRLDELEREARAGTSRSGSESVLVIGDTHEPFCLPGYLDFCRSVQERFGCGQIVHIGDEVDNHAISYHEKDPDGMSAGSEAERALERMRRWYEAFPVVDVLVGNHGALPFRKAKTHGLPKRFLRAYEEVWEAPDGWRWHDELERDGVLYVHGTGSGGKNGALNRSIATRMSVVMGHSHSYGGVQYSSNGRNQIFGMNVGCGVDISAYAMSYGKVYPRKPTLGCGVVMQEGQMGLFVPMEM
jgi:predicted phosphodiesterase